MRDEKRTYLNLPVRVAPVKCSILTVINHPDYKPFVDNISIFNITNIQKCFVKINFLTEK